MDQPRVVKALLAATLAATKYANTDKLKLFKSSFVPDQNSVYADFLANQVAFDGYNLVTLNLPWNNGLSGAGDASLIYSGLATFSQTGIAVTDIAGGFWIGDTGDTVLKLVFLFDIPFMFDAIGNELIIKPTEQLTDNSGADVEMIFGP